MKQKQQIPKAVQIPAPHLTFKTALRVSEDSLSANPRSADLEPELALQELEPQPSGDSLTQQQEIELSLDYALLIRSANYWLALGEIEQALLELGALSETASAHSSAVKVRVAIVRATRKRNEVTFQE